MDLNRNPSKLDCLVDLLTTLFHCRAAVNCRQLQNSFCHVYSCSWAVLDSAGHTLHTFAEFSRHNFACYILSSHRLYL